MKILTYEDLKPYLTAENRLWTEDDTTMHMEGHETIRMAWEKVFGVEHPNNADAVAKTDFGDSGDWIFADGRVSCWAYDGGEIHQISDEGMRALGLAAPEPYPAHTPPQAPEGMKWEYRGKAWRSHRCVEYYALEDDGVITHASGPSQGVDSSHYFEAVPVPESTDPFPQTKLSPSDVRKLLSSTKDITFLPKPVFTPPDIAAVNTLLSHGIALLEKWRDVREESPDSPAVELYGVLTETWIAAAHVFMGSGNNES